MNINSFFKKYQITISDCFLKNTTKDIEEFKSKELIYLFKNGYNNGDPNILRLTTVLNGVFTHHAQTFMITRRILSGLIKNDNNSPYNQINGIDYKFLLSLMIKNNDFICLRPSTNKKAGVYKLVNEELVQELYKLHSAEWFGIQEQKVCEFHDENINENNKKEKSKIEKTKEKWRKQGFNI